MKSVKEVSKQLLHDDYVICCAICRKLKGDWWKAKLCTSCVSPLGRILSRGGHCPQCGLRVCKNCRFYGAPNRGQVPNNGQQNNPNWICILCSGSAPNYATLPKSNNIGKSIRRSWTISNPQRGQNNSPVLKSYVTFKDDNTTSTNLTANSRQFNSLPRLSYGIQNENYPLDSPHSYSTLYTFKTNKATSNTSVNFIEDPFWDYYDYSVINHSNRSSCERSLGETESYTYIIDPDEQKRHSQTLPPVKPERSNKRSNSLNSYDGKKLSFSPLRTYVVLRQPQQATPVVVTKKRSSSFNLDYSDTKRNRGSSNKGESRDIISDLKRPLSEYQLNFKTVPKNVSEVRRSTNGSNEKLFTETVLITEQIRSSADENRFKSPTRPELNALFSSQSLPKRKSTTRHQFLSDLLSESPDSAPKLAKYFHSEESQADTSSTVPRARVVKPPRKVPPSPPVNSDRPSQPTLVQERERLGEPIDPKLENLLRKSEKILNPNVNIVTIEHEYQTFPRRKHLTTVPVVLDSDINTQSLDRRYPQNILKIKEGGKDNNNEVSSSGSSCEDLIVEEVLSATDTEDEEDESEGVSGEKTRNRNVVGSVVTVGGGWVYRAPPPPPSQETSLASSPAQPSEQVSNQVVRSKERTRRKNPNKNNKLTDLNSQYAHSYGLKEGNQYPGSPRPNSTFSNLRIIKGRSSNEFVTTVQINNDMCHEPITVNPILRIHDNHQHRETLTSIRQKIVPANQQEDQQVALNSSGSELPSNTLPYIAQNTSEKEISVLASDGHLVNIKDPSEVVHPYTPDFESHSASNASTENSSSDETIVEFFRPTAASENNLILNDNGGDNSGSVSDTKVCETGTIHVTTTVNSENHKNDDGSAEKIIVSSERTSVAEKIKDLIFGDSETLIIPAYEETSGTKQSESFRKLLEDLHETLKTDLVTRKSEADRESDIPGIFQQSPPSNAPSVVTVSESELEDKIGGIAEVTPNVLELFEGSTCSEHSEDLLLYLHAIDSSKATECAQKTEQEGSDISTTPVPEPEEYISHVEKSVEYSEIRDLNFTLESPNHCGSSGFSATTVETISSITKPEAMMEHNERLTPEGQESFSNESTTTKRSSPDGEEIHDIKAGTMEEEPFEVTSSDSDNSWVEEIPYEEGPPPLDLTLHTIVEESCEESCDESLHSLHMARRKAPDALENYFNYLDPAQVENAEMQRRRLANEDSEFSDTFSESSFNSEVVPPHEEDSLIDPVDLASTRLEKYFTNLSYDNSAEQYSEDSVGSESECDDHIKDKKKKVLKHKRSANVSDDESIFDQDEGAFDTIKKVSKKKQPEKQQQQPETNSSQSQTGKETNEQSDEPQQKSKQVLLDRSNSFQWSSDEEVNLMMSKLRHLIKNLMQKSQAAPSESNSQLRYFETELIRLMRAEPELKNIVSEYISSEESDDNEFNQFIKDVVTQQESQEPDKSPSDHRQRKDLGTTVLGQNTSPALIAKVMHHIGNRLSVWMKDEEEEGSLKCAPSVSSDLNEDRFSWKGSFESTLAAKRQSVGSTDSISSSDLNNHPASSGVDRSILRSSSLHHLANSQPIEEKREEEENISSSLPKLNQVANMSRAQSLIGIKEKVKSARYRPPGFNQAPNIIKQIDDKMSMSTPTLHQDTHPHGSESLMNLRSSTDSFSSIFENSVGRINIRGQIEFGLQYNYKLASLEVRVNQCKDLAAVDTKRNRSDPYVKAYLLPDRSKSGKRKTKTKKNTLAPVFEETLKFPVTLSELQTRTLWMSVWHNDIFGKNEFLGQVIVNLKDRVFDDPSPVWWSLEEISVQADDHPLGDLVIALKWQPRTQNTGNLSVLIKEAKNLLPTRNGCPSTFVKCCPLKDPKYHRMKQKTSIARRTLHPIWNQTLYFEDIPDDGVEVSLWSYDLLSNHDLIGTVRLDSDNPLWESMLNRHSFWVEGGLKLEHHQQSP